MNDEHKICENTVCHSPVYRIVATVLVRENTGQWKLVFSDIICSDQCFLWITESIKIASIKMRIEMKVLWHHIVESFRSFPKETLQECERVTEFFLNTHAIIALWKQDGSFKTDLQKYVEQSLTREEIVDFVKCDYSNFKWSTVFPLISVRPQISAAL